MYLYTGDVAFSPVEIKKKVKDTLNVEINSDRLKFIYLTRRKWVEADKYPVFTLLGQLLGSIYLGFEAINQINPGKRLIISSSILAAVSNVH